MGMISETGQQLSYYTPLQDFDTKQAIDVSGVGCLMVKTDVFKKIPMPWFRYYDPYLLGGDFSITGISEEMHTFASFHKAGIKTLLVPEVKCGHECLKVIGSPEQ